jgi:mRNA-degrading endonuclease YafQ of YafQ-DinJ toxin-antitoxin module
LKRALLPTKAFARSAKRLAQRDYAFADDLRATLALPEEDAFHPALKTHKLKGKLKHSWACSAGYNSRIVFQFVRYHNSDAILLEAVGSHDEVY